MKEVFVNLFIGFFATSFSSFTPQSSFRPPHRFTLVKRISGRTFTPLSPSKPSVEKIVARTRIHFACFLPWVSRNFANSDREIPYQSFPLFGDQRIPLGFTRTCPTTLPLASTISKSSNLRGLNEFVAIFSWL